MQAVIVRCHDPSPAAAHRLAKWATDLQDSKQNIDFIISLDNTHAFNQTSNERRSKKRKRASQRKSIGCASQHTSPPTISPTHRLLRTFAEYNITNVHIHRYTEQDLLKNFPGLLPLQTYILKEMKVQEMISKKCTMAWGFHVEALLLWWKWSLKKKQEYDYVWVFEDDVGIKGSLLDLLQCYQDEQADLLTDNAHSMNEDWFWKNVHTSNFLNQTGGNELTCCSEHVQRFSNKLMERLTNLCSNGVHAWSEAFTSTVANNADDLILKGFCVENVGDPYKWNGRVTEDEWIAIMKEEESSTPKMYHALKF